ncbi:hypothetical protein RND81_08G055200 [Saponaria officinalis]|uniref:Uncharacterized protein n=1 Tax=Saponaria officinalis TaxID=3572 RepID=A0AAW1J3M1_SAPOF
MDLGIKFKLLKFPSFFTSSCKTQNLDEVIDHSKNPIFTPQNSIFFHSPLMEKIHDNVEEKDEEDKNENYPFNNFVIKTKPRNLNSFSSHQNTSSSSSSLMCKPRCPETFDQMVRESCIIGSGGKNFNRRKVAGKYSLLSPSGDFSGRRCPPTSPASPLFLKQGKNKNKKKQKEKIPNNRNNYHIKNGFKSNPFSFSSSNETDDNGDWFSSDDEREEDDDINKKN